jgi:hypothetical protein
VSGSVEAVVVLLVAFVVAAVVYVFAARRVERAKPLADDAWRTEAPRVPADSGTGWVSDVSDDEPIDEFGAAHLPLVRSGASWHTRVSGVLALILLVFLASAALAVSVYEVGSRIARMITNAAHPTG